MISRAICAPRVCLSCRIGLARRRAGLGASLLARSDGFGLRRYASDSTGIQSKDLVEALISGKKTFEERDKEARQEKARQTRRRRKPQGKGRGRGKAKEEDEGLGWGGADKSNNKAPFAFRGGLQEPLGDSNSPAPKIRTAAAPDEPFPEDYQPWQRPQPKPEVPIETHRDLHTPEKPRELPELPELPESNHEAPESQEPEEIESEEFEPEEIEPEEIESKETESEEARDTHKPLPDLRAPQPFKHEYLRQQHLSIDALGRRVGALIIKNPNQLGRKPRGSLILPDQTVSSGELDWKSMLPIEDAEVDAAAEASKHIEEMRPTDSLTLPRNRFHQLNDDLAFGFTKNQLALYYSQRGKTVVPRPSETPSYSWLMSQTAWKPSNPEEPGHASTKHHLARMIMTVQWGLQIQEEVESPGLATVSVRPDSFQLVAQSHTGVLDALTAGLLDESIGETITPTEHHHSLEIYARKAAIPTLLARLDEILKTVITRSVSVEDLDPKSLRKDVLDELARVTKTVIQHNKEAKRLKVSRIANEDDLLEMKDEGVTPMEDSADIILRLLRGRPTQRLQSEEQIVARRFKSQVAISQAGMLVPHCRENKSMSWRDKLRPWSRFVTPIGAPGEFKGRWLKFAEKVRIPGPEPSIYEDNAWNRLTTTFGHILHSKPEPGERRKMKQRRRIIAPVVPHPAAFAEFIPKKEAELKKRSQIVLNFAPAPGTHDGEAPEVRLTLPINSEDDLSNFSMPSSSTLNAVVPWFVKDTLIPEESVDVRIMQQREIPLDISEQKPIREFFAASEFNLAEGRLRTPSSTQFSMPKRWLGKEDEQDSTVDLPYMFAGLEIHQTVDLQLQNHILRYSSIEAGQHGGTRQELSLEAKISVKHPEKAVGQMKSYLELVQTAIEGKCWSWTKGSDQVRELPSENDPFWERTSQDLNDAEKQDMTRPTESPLIEELLPRPGELIDVAEESEEALQSGEHLAASVNQALGAQSEPGAEGSIAKDGTGTSVFRGSEEALRSGACLIESIEESLRAQSEPGAQDFVAEDTTSTSAVGEFEEVLRAGAYLIESIEETLRAQGEGSAQNLVEENTATIGQELEEAIAASQLLVEEVEGTLRTHDESRLKENTPPQAGSAS